MKSNTSRKVLFVHDGPIYEDGNGNFYGTGMDDKIRQRYLSMGTEVSFLMRVTHEKAENCKNRNLIKNERFNVIEVPDFKSVLGHFIHKAKARKIISRAVHQHDIIIVRLPSGIGSLAVYYADRAKKPLLSEMVACTKDTYWYHSLKGKIVAHYFYYKQQTIMEKVHYCMYVTENFLQQRYPINGKSISCSDVTIENMSDRVLERRCHKIKESENRPLVIGSIGKLSMRLKGHIDVIYALAELKAKGYNYHYKLVGGGNTDHLVKLIKRLNLENEVTIIGPLPRDGIFTFIDDIDLYIQPSRTEGLPRAMVEAMSRACPVMGSTVGGIPELVHPDSSFKSGDIQQIEKCIVSFDKIKRLREASRSFYKAKEYQNESLTKKRNSFYRLFLEDHNFKGHE